MRYLVYVEWGSTKGNHAGMAYLAKRIKQEFPYKVKIIKIPVFHFHGGKYVANTVSVLKLIKLLVVLKDSDHIFLMEYLPSLHNWAYWIKKIHRNCKVTALVHFVNEVLDSFYPNSDKLNKHESYVDKQLVLGHSLKEYLVGRGVNESKIKVTFHYVDVDYYFKKDHNNTKLQVIFLGSLKRDFDLLRNIIQSCPNTDFHILMGKKNLRQKFSDLSNVVLHPYLTEDELRNLMQHADVSLNVMKDTIGSNVIVTSMACGLAMVVSDVGSIRDYCDDGHAFFCRTITDYTYAIEQLSKDKQLLERMKHRSYEKAQDFSLNKFLMEFNGDLLK